MKVKTEKWLRKRQCYALVRDNSSERIGPSPYDKEYANRRGRQEENEWKRSYRLWFGGRACFWALKVSM
jgi:hypothetical protein